MMKLKTVLGRLFLFGTVEASRRSRTQCGFTLIEVLVAVLVLSIGMLGLAAMQLNGLQSAHLSYQRTLATASAKDAVDRLWVKLWELPDSCPDPADVTGEWHEAWEDLLVDMEAASDIEAASSGSCEYTVTVVWQDTRFSSEDDPSRLVYVARLPQAL